MENKTLLQFEQQYIKFSKELTQIKKELNFDKLLVEYRKLKKVVWKANQEVKNNEDESKTRELELNLKDLEKNQENSIAKFKKVEIVENKLYNVKKRLISKIASLDSVKNSNDYIIKSLENKNDELSKKIDPNHKETLEKEISKLEKEVKALDKEIQSLTDEKKPSNLLKFEKNEKNKQINKLKSTISINERANKEVIKESIKRNTEIIKTKQAISKERQKEIDFAIKIMDKIDKGLSFRDADEINHDSSFTVKHLDVFYGQKQALFDINIELPKNKVISIIGPSGCGKSTFLRTLNRINDNISTFRAKGKILLDGEYDIFKLRSIRNRYDRIELSTLRTKVGMIFQQPNPFPMTIEKNVQYGPRVKGIKNKSTLTDLTEQSLKDAGLWEEVKDNLKALGTSLSGGQQQRLCIARAIANEPEILLMDEPTSALDPIAAKIIEDLILKLKEHYTIIMVTHSMQQAQRISDFTAFFYQGELIEYGKTKQIFENPKQKETKDYISGKFG